MKQVIRLQVPIEFNFWITVRSSGWCSLAPFSFDEKSRTLLRFHELTSGRIVKMMMEEETWRVLAVKVDSTDELERADIEEIEGIVRTCLRLEKDLSPFYEILEGYPEFAWVRKMGAGRLIRSPTVFEDVVKTICSTNCSWALTKAMSERLCRKLGRSNPDGLHTFPTPRLMALSTEEFIRAEVKAGYRSPHLIELARKQVGGELDVEAWMKSPLDSTSLKREIMRIKGVGEYAASHILKLLGRYDFLALDSWLRRRFSQIHGGGKTVPDEGIEEFYAPFGSWKGLVIWLDMIGERLVKL